MKTSPAFFFAATHLAFFVLVATVPDTLSAAQTITYTHGENKTDPIVLNPGDSTTLAIADGTAIQSGAISGAITAIVVKTEAGTLILRGDNSAFTGKIQLAEGTLIVSETTNLLSELRRFTFTGETATLGIAAYSQLIFDSSDFGQKSGNHRLVGNSGFVGNQSSVLVHLGDSARFSLSNALSYGDGGAVSANGKVEFFGKNARISLTDNSAASSGGAIVAYGSNVSFLGDNNSILISNNSAASSGGAIWTRSNALFSGNDTTLSLSDNSAGNHGGAIYAFDGNINFSGDRTSILINNNSATEGSGGALYANVGDVSFSGNDSRISLSDNSANYHGGAIYATSGDVMFSGDNSLADFSNNNSLNNSGGAIYAKNIGFSGNNTSLLFSNNTANTQGGAFFASNSVVFSGLNGNVVFEGNHTVNSNGGAIYSANVTLAGQGSNFVFSNNFAYFSGGAIAVNNGQFTLASDAIFSGNKANNFFGTGGAIWTNNTINITADGYGGISFSGNKAGSSGGAIYLESSAASSPAGDINYLYAKNSDITFSGNKSGVTFDGTGNPVEGSGIANSVHLNNHNGTTTLVLAADSDRQILFLDPVTSSMTNNSGTAANVAIVINSTDGTSAGKTGGTILFSGENFDLTNDALANVQSDVRANTSIHGGTFELKDNARYGVANLGYIDGTSLELKSGAFLRSTATRDGVVNAIIAQNNTFAQGSSIVFGGSHLSSLSITSNDTGYIRMEGAIRYNLGKTSNGAGSDTITASGTVIFGGGAVIDLSSISQTLVDHAIISAFQIEGAPTVLTLNGLDIGTDTRATGAASFSKNNASLLLTSTAVENTGVTWNGGTSGAWDISSRNWVKTDSYASDGVGINGGQFIDADAVRFVIDSDTSIALAGTGKTVASLHAEVSNGTLVLASDPNQNSGIRAVTAENGGSTLADASGKLVKTGAGTLDLTGITGRNEFLGGIDLQDGVLAVSRADQLGASLGQVRFTGDTASLALKNHAGTAGTLYAFDGNNTDRHRLAGNDGNGHGSVAVDLADNVRFSIKNSYADNGGAISAQNEVRLHGINSTVVLASNTATSGGAINTVNGGVSLTGNFQLSDNRATSGSGGAIQASTGIQVIAQGTEGVFITNNTASISGGAFHILGESVNAADNASLIYAQNSDVFFSENTVEGNPIYALRFIVNSPVANAIHIGNYNGNSSLHLAAEAGRSISFRDPLTSAMTDNQNAEAWVSVSINSTDDTFANRTSGTVTFSGQDFNQNSADVKSDIRANTTVHGGTFELRDNARYGVADVQQYIAGTSFILKDGSTLKSTAGRTNVTNAIIAETITFSENSTIEIDAGSTLELTGNVTLEKGAALVWKLDGNTNTDSSKFSQLSINGQMTIENEAVLKLVLSSNVNLNDAFWEINQQWVLFDSVSSPQLGTMNIILEQDSNTNGRGFMINQSSAGLTLEWTTAIPEPSTYGMLIALGLGMAAVRYKHSSRRRTKSSPDGRSNL